MATAPTQDYQAFNKFQTYFYTSIEGFEQFTNFEIKTHTFVLLSNLTKGFPTLATEIMDVYAPDFVTFDNSPSLIKALQRRFVNNFSKPRVPQHIYYKKAKQNTVKKPKAIKAHKGLLIFDNEIQFEIKSKLFYDSKTYEMLKFSEKVQNLGKQLIAEFDKTELIFLKKSKKREISI